MREEIAKEINMVGSKDASFGDSAMEKYKRIADWHLKEIEKAKAEARIEVAKENLKLLKGNGFYTHHEKIAIAYNQETIKQNKVQDKA